MNVRELRTSKGWTQEQLAEFSGLSVRTIQRIEQGHQPGFETLKSLAATFEIDWREINASLFKEIPKMNDTILPNDDLIAEIRREIRRRRKFYVHLAQYVVVITALFAINLLTRPNHIWAIWPALGWGVGLAMHGFSVLKPFQAYQEEWEKRQIEKHLKAHAKREKSA